MEDHINLFLIFYINTELDLKIIIIPKTDKISKLKKMILKATSPKLTKKSREPETLENTFSLNHYLTIGEFNNLKNDNPFITYNKSYILAGR